MCVALLERACMSRFVQHRIQSLITTCCALCRSQSVTSRARSSDWGLVEISSRMKGWAPIIGAGSWTECEWCRQKTLEERFWRCSRSWMRLRHSFFDVWRICLKTASDIQKTDWKFDDQSGASWTRMKKCANCSTLAKWTSTWKYGDIVMTRCMESWSAEPVA